LQPCSVSHRFAELVRVFRPDAAKPAEILASFQRFYFDTALSSGPAALQPRILRFTVGPANGRTSLLAGDLDCECLSEIRHIRRIEVLAPFISSPQPDYLAGLL